MNHEEIAILTFKAWYTTLPTVSDFPAKGTIAGALAVLDRLKEDFNLDIDHHTAPGGSQIKGTSGSTVKSILARYGENRPFVSEGGRTNRGLRGQIKEMLDAIRTARLDHLSKDDRNEVLTKLQQFLVDRVRDWHNRQRLHINYNSSKSTHQIIGELLRTARETGKGGQVAQYLVGAKLEQRLRNTDIQVSNESYSTADVQLNRKGDFLIQDTVFHVTLSPALPVFEKCKRNLEDGYRVFLLVPDNQVFGARSTAEGTAPGQIAVESIESFVSQNIDEMSLFSGKLLKQELIDLLKTYNRRVDAIEIDKSILIEIPPSLER